jgi:M6 family metalloprotease-like protein
MSKKSLLLILALGLLFLPILSLAQEFSAVPMHPKAIEKARALGKAIKSPEPASANQGRKFEPGGTAIGQLATAAQQKVLVIFIDFQTPPIGGPSTRLSLSYFDDLLFGTSYNPPEYNGYKGAPTDRTLKNFYDVNSYGTVDVLTLNLPTTIGWTKVGHDYNYYVNNDNGYGKIGSLIVEALTALDPVIDFSKYAIAGEVPNIFVVHAGSGAEWNGDPRLFWSHSWNLRSATGASSDYVFDGVIVNKYALMPEVGGDTTGIYGDPAFVGPFPPTVGVYAHEFGHVLGLPDQYDYGYESDGTGPFTIMAGGSWNQYPFDYIFGGNSPSNFDAWSKYRLGFVHPIEIAGPMIGATLPPSETSPTVYKMVVPNSEGKEYFLFENRQHIGFDQGLAYIGGGTHGLAIYHIDDLVLNRNYWRPNEAENWKSFRSLGWKKAWTGETHYGISLMQADGRWELEHGAAAGTFPSSGDLYPGHWGITRFDSYSDPNSSNYYFWNGSDSKYGFSGVTVVNIQEKNGDITADFSFVPWTPPGQ